MLGKRLFISIDLPENLKKKLADFRKKWPDLPAQWTKDYNLHITLVFLGFVRDENLLDICNKAKEAVKGCEEFEIVLEKICYGPYGKPPRMVWAEGGKSKGLAQLQANLEKEFFSGINQNMEKYIPKTERKPFSPHITLARIKQIEFKRMEKEEIPIIDEKVSFSFPVSSIEIVESELKKGGPVYTILESIPL